VNIPTPISRKDTAANRTSGEMDKPMRNQYKTPKAGQGFCKLALGTLLLIATTMFGQQPRLSKDLRNLRSSDSVDVIVQYHVVPGRDHFDRVRSKGGVLKYDLSGLKAGAFHVPARALVALANDPDVDYVGPDRPIHATVYSNDPDYYEQAVLAPSSWNQYDGTGIGVAIIDSGITNNGDFGSRIVYSQSFVPGQSSTTDAYGHGTHVAGIVGGDGANSTGSSFTKTFVGIANNAKIVNLRVLDQNGSGSDSAVIAAIQKAIALKNTYNIRVINLSLGRGVFESYKNDPLCQAVESAWKAGIVVVVAAGNDGRNNSASTGGYGTINAPGNDPYAITVGAMKPEGTPDRADDLIASYSSKGPTLFDHVVKPDILAPGNYVISTMPASNATLVTSKNVIQMGSYKTNGGTAASSAYFVLNGTSMATPVVSAAAALMLQKTPSLTPDQLKARMMKTAYKNFPQESTATDSVTGATYRTQYDIFAVGAGYLDMQNAMESTDLASAVVGIAASPSVARDSSGNIYLVTGSSVLWGSSVMWGSSVVWGTSVIWGTNTSGSSVLWGSSVCWGSSTDQAYSVLWGSSVMWGSSVIWGASTEAQTAQSITINGEK
jgi:serine protease AprX